AGQGNVLPAVGVGGGGAGMVVDPRRHAAKGLVRQGRRLVGLGRLCCSLSAVYGIVARLFFFFEAEDGIGVWSVTGVQTCALPISARSSFAGRALPLDHARAVRRPRTRPRQTAGAAPRELPEARRRRADPHGVVLEDSSHSPAARLGKLPSERDLLRDRLELVGHVLLVALARVNCGNHECVSFSLPISTAGTKLTS